MRRGTTLPKVDANRLRIIGGEWRSRVIRFPPTAALRPTPDRVRETLFNWLGQDMTGRVCLDLFAGSGALGFESLSRNARSVTFVDADQKVRLHLNATAQLLGAGARARVEAGDALEFLRHCPEQFHVIFLDPPFGAGWIERLWPAIERALAQDGVVYVESGTLFNAPAGWRILKSGRAGTVHFHLAGRDG
ncbi:MAG: 16S rRNA (guanine(966)-N(2))-methyltransferase RsmD [Burkholderiales bacterium]|nr:16S rRNA (guanine(966)-N(2))-methyltransferase RsmD [Burkholderiales bacterium]